MLKIHLACTGFIALVTLVASGAEPRRDLYGDPLPVGAVARIGTVRLRSVGETTGVALSPDGKVLVTMANWNQPLRVWDTTTGALDREIPLPPDESRKLPPGARVPPESPAAITFLGDSSRLHVLMESGGVRAYDFATSTWSTPSSRSALSGTRRTFNGWAIADGTRFVFAPRSGSVKGLEVFDVGKDAAPTRIDGPDLRTPLWSVSGSSDTGRVAAMMRNGAARVWDRAGKEVTTHQPPEGIFYSVAISPDGKEMAGVCGPEKRTPEPPASAIYLYCWDLATGKERFRVPRWEGLALTYTPDGRRLVSFTRNEVLVADAATGKEIHRMRGHGAWIIIGHSFGASGKRLATGSRDHTAIIWDLDTGKPALDFDSPRGPVKVLAFSPDGKTLFSACNGDHTGGLWDADTGKRVLRIVVDGKGGPMCAAFTADGRQLVVGYGQWGSTGSGKDWSARLLAVADGKLICEYGGHSNGVRRLAISADGKTLATHEYDKAVRLWDFGSGKLIGEFDWARYNAPSALAFDAKGALVGASYDDQRELGVSDLLTRKVLTRWAGDGAQSLTLSPDGRFLAIMERSQRKGSMVILDVRSGAVVQTLAGLPSSSFGLVDFSADGQTVAVTDGTGLYAEDAVHLYDVKTGEERRTIRGHKGQISGLAFSPDGRRLATGGWDSTVLVWDLTAAPK